ERERLPWPPRRVYSVNRGSGTLKIWSRAPTGARKNLPEENGDTGSENPAAGLRHGPVRLCGGEAISQIGASYPLGGNSPLHGGYSSPHRSSAAAPAERACAAGA